MIGIQWWMGNRSKRKRRIASFLLNTFTVLVEEPEGWRLRRKWMWRLRVLPRRIRRMLIIVRTVPIRQERETRHEERQPPPGARRVTVTRAEAGCEEKAGRLIRDKERKY
jgi:hypothetical protein